MVTFTPEQVRVAIMEYAYQNPDKIVEYFTTDNVSYDAEYALGVAVVGYTAREVDPAAIGTVLEELLDSIDEKEEA